MSWVMKYRGGIMSKVFLLEFDDIVSALPVFLALFDTGVSTLGATMSA